MPWSRVRVPSPPQWGCSSVGRARKKRPVPTTCSRFLQGVSRFCEPNASVGYLCLISIAAGFDSRGASDRRRRLVPVKRPPAPTCSHFFHEPTGRGLSQVQLLSFPPTGMSPLGALPHQLLARLCDHSSDGRALARHARGHRFESCWSHHIEEGKMEHTNPTRIPAASASGLVT